jgi:hypothetical protein
MTIDLEKEELIGLGAATRYVPRRRGRKVHASTLHRWATRGYRGVLLDAVRTPSGWCTSVKAVQRFLSALANQEREQIRRMDDLIDRARRGA